MNDDDASRRGSSSPNVADGARAVGVVSDWEQVPSQAAALVDNLDLIAMTHAILEVTPPPALAAKVFSAVIDTMAQCSSPTVFQECLVGLLSSSTALEYGGSRLSDMCLERGRVPAVSAGPKAWLLAADALEGATRLALGGWVPHFAVLAQLIQLPALSPPFVARVGLRCLAAAYEHWREPALLAAIERLAGLTPVAADIGIDQATAEEWSREVAPEAAYELGCASLLLALSGETVSEAEEHLQAAERRLNVAAVADRVDAEAMTDVVRLLAAHLPTDAGRAVLESTDMPALAERLERHVREHVLGYSGLMHWRSPRLDSEIAWAQLAHNVARTSAALTEPSWYYAEVVLSDILAAYTASRCSRVLRRDDLDGVQAILGPTIESGIAIQAGLMKHLDDHIRTLEAQETDSAVTHALAHGRAPLVDAGRSAELTAARSLLAAARTRLASPEPHPKTPGSADASVPPDGSPALPFLHTMLRGDPAAIASLHPDVARRLETAIAEGREAAGGGLSGGDVLVIEETLARLQPELSCSTYYHGDVKDAVDEVLVLLLRFWRSRDGLGGTKMAYLFDPSAVEEDLADDLKLWFDGTPHARRTATEVRYVGGGRVDVACVFPQFRLYIELKKDERNLEVAEMRRYLQQTAGYQSADVAIGFLAILDLRPRTGPSPHLTSCFGVVVLDDPDLGQPRYIVSMTLPGNRTKPSSMH